MPIAKVSKQIATAHSINKYIALGEFWIEENGELWTDPTDLETTFHQQVQFAKIIALQKKLRPQRASGTATRYSNRRPLV